MLPIILFSLARPPASLEGAWHYRAFNARGQVVADGRIAFRSAIYISLKQGERAWRYFGDQKIRETDPLRYGPHGNRNGKGDPVAGADLAADGTFHASLNHRTPERGIILDGQRRGMKIEGVWSWLDGSRSRARGRFVLNAEPGKRVH